MIDNRDSRIGILWSPTQAIHDPRNTWWEEQRIIGVHRFWRKNVARYGLGGYHPFHGWDSSEQQERFERKKKCNTGWRFFVLGEISFASLLVEAHGSWPVIVFIISLSFSIVQHHVPPLPIHLVKYDQCPSSTFRYRVSLMPHSFVNKCHISWTSVIKNLLRLTIATFSSIPER